jgi:hypothetical protein
MRDLANSLNNHDDNQLTRISNTQSGVDSSPRHSNLPLGPQVCKCRIASQLCLKRVYLGKCPTAMSFARDLQLLVYLLDRVSEATR